MTQKAVSANRCFANRYNAKAERLFQGWWATLRGKAVTLGVKVRRFTLLWGAVIAEVRTQNSEVKLFFD
ncbi:hypothetical protein L8106_18831 [Lyngbya sp. PCC 8106]|nr:hypothetical protein L8106_18831 [Lyngbya sp. PCC 8106]